MKRLAFVILASATLLASLFSGATRGNSLELPGIVRASEERLEVTQQTLSGVTTRVSVASNGTQGNDVSSYSSLSADGRYVAFRSFASNLVSGDTNDADDVFVHNQQTNQTSLVSVASDGTQGNSQSTEPSISADGRYVAFFSFASNLVSGDTNGEYDVFVHNQQTNQTSLVSVASDGTQGNNDSYYPSLSADGRYVAFESYASNLVSSDTNAEADVFVRDRQTNQTSLVSVASDGTQGNALSLGPSISADGHYVVFDSDASNLVNGDTNGMRDVFIRDRQTNQTSRISVSSNGTQGNSSSYYPFLSADGRYVAFASAASNLVSSDTNGASDVFVHDRQTNQTSLISVTSNGAQGNNGSYSPSISTDGRYVAFNSAASNLVSGDTNGRYDVFVRDRQTGKTSRISVTSNGTEGNSDSYSPSISVDGRYVAFESYASDLVSGDINSSGDVFVHAFPTYVYLPMVLKTPPTTYLFIKNNTTGIVSYTVQNTPQGNITCSNIPPGATILCGSFTPGTYNVSVSAHCGTSSGQVTFPPGEVTRPVSC